MTCWTHVESPLGDLLAARDEAGLTDLYLPSGRHRRDPQPEWGRDDDAFDDVRCQLAEYFAGTRTEFDLALHPAGSPFQQRVWQALRDIPFGETRSYGQQTAAIGAPVTAARAVGAANGRNPISIIVPCHRVIGANGALVGYGGGLDAKRWLLGHEAQHAGLFALT